MAHEVQVFYYDISQGQATMVSGLLQSLAGSNVQPLEGIWHSAVVVHDQEVFYGDGVCWMCPGTTPYGSPVKVERAGRTDMSWQAFRSWAMEQGAPGAPFGQGTYSLVSHNCNHFTHQALLHLTGVGLPDEVVNLPRHVVRTGVQGLSAAWNAVLGGATGGGQSSTVRPSSGAGRSHRDPYRMDPPTGSSPPLRGGPIITEVVTDEEEEDVLENNKESDDEYHHVVAVVLGSAARDVPPSCDVTIQLPNWTTSRTLPEASNTASLVIIILHLAETLKSGTPQVVSLALDKLLAAPPGPRQSTCVLVIDDTGSVQPPHTTSLIRNVICGSALRNGVRVVESDDLSFAVVAAMGSTEAYSQC